MTQKDFKAPAGKFRVIGVDTFDGTDWIAADYDSLDESTLFMADHTDGKQMLKMHCYDDTGKWLCEAGSL